MFVASLSVRVGSRRIDQPYQQAMTEGIFASPSVRDQRGGRIPPLPARVLLAPGRAWTRRLMKAALPTRAARGCDRRAAFEVSCERSRRRSSSAARVLTHSQARSALPCRIALHRRPDRCIFFFRKIYEAWTQVMARQGEKTRAIAYLRTSSTANVG